MGIALLILFFLRPRQVAMLPDDSHKKKIVDILAARIPAFTDIFDEETFYIFAFVLTLVSICVVVFLSRRVTIKDAGHTD
ncbi:hypothetical protein CHS0354_017084 [Potamilus streckersoni]|uniref:Uncharacterized protein n=1 Tax=Potamilus streckersoni TaxID=2493646 RepID=A0AAE0SCR9_9BIVA|nr:hypothetical protein CHS0354_017084 [Potamilus streckersoni]